MEAGYSCTEIEFDLVLRKFIKKKVITLNDLEGFSQDLIDSITEIINR